MPSFSPIATRPRLIRQLTGLPTAAWERLLSSFERAYREDLQRRERDTPRQRRSGGGRHGTLDTCADKLFFLLFYYRHYPTQEVLALLFGFSQGQANHWIHRLTPLVNQALGYQLQLPARQPRKLEQVLERCSELRFLIDGTDRPIRRPKDKQHQKDDYSGKKKRHTKKNIILTEAATGQIKGLGATQPGSKHDKACVDAENYRFPEGSTLYQDTGFQGYRPTKVHIYQPQKKAKGKALTDEEKASNRWISSVRVKVEHSIGGLKVYRIVHDVCRNFKEGFVDQVMETVCGLFNLRKAVLATR